MRLDDDAVIEAAIDAGIEWLDTAHAYEGNEARIARVLEARRARVITKVGMTRPAGAWVPDGRAKTVLEQARESHARLGRAPDLLMLHAPDPSVPLATSVRALARARDEGLAHAIGLSNPSRRDLDELTVPIAAIEVALGPKHDAAARAGMLAWCKERKVRVFAHSPLGGVAHASKLAKDTVLSAIAKRLGATAAEVMLAYLAALGAIPIPGARRLESVASLARASSLRLAEEELVLLDARFPGLAVARSGLRPPADPTAEVVLVMGLAGAGKSSLMTRFPEHERLNRDLLGGTLAGVAKRLEAALARGATRVVLDNTYLSRAARSDVVRVAHRAGAAVKCIHLEISLADARINVANRMLERYDALLGAREMKAKRDPNLLLPTSLAAMHRQLERPSPD
jgi:diketogulonate reductase-like aldo/keto reductase